MSCGGKEHKMGEKLTGILLNRVQTETFDDISDKTCEFIKRSDKKGQWLAWTCTRVT